MTRAVAAAMQVALGAGSAELLATGRRRDLGATGRQSSEDRMEAIDRLFLTADHQAIPAVQSPHAAARANVHVMDALPAQLLRAADVVDVVGVSAIDEDVIC